MFNNNYNPYYGQTQRFQPTEPIQPMNTQPYIPPQQHNVMQQTLLGKSVDSIDVVKAMDIPLDGSISYFPLTDGSAIVTKRLQNDGTSKTTVYRPVVDENESTTPTYVTFEDLDNKLKDLDFSSDIKSFKEELKSINKQIKKINVELTDKED